LVAALGRDQSPDSQDRAVARIQVREDPCQDPAVYGETVGRQCLLKLQELRKCVGDLKIPGDPVRGLIAKGNGVGDLIAAGGRIGRRDTLLYGEFGGDDHGLHNVGIGGVGDGWGPELGRWSR